MSKVVCWCCEKFVLKETTEIELAYSKNIDGKCTLKNISCTAQDKVCQDFVLRNGLFTKRTIPSYCKNYK